MKLDSPYYRFDPPHDTIANVYGSKYDPVPGTNGQTGIPRAETLDIRFHEPRRVRRWPQAFSGDDYVIKFFAKDLAHEMTIAGFTGVEFHPVNFEFGDLRGLRGKEAQRPEYVWARVTGLLLVDLETDGVPERLDPTGMFTLDPPPSGRRWQRRIREHQPFAADFCRPVPGGSAYIAISRRVTDYFDSLKLKELTYGAVGNGFL